MQNLFELLLLDIKIFAVQIPICQRTASRPKEGSGVIGKKFPGILATPGLFRVRTYADKYIWMKNSPDYWHEITIVRNLAIYTSRP